MSLDFKEFFIQNFDKYRSRKRELEDNLIRCCVPFEMADVDLKHYLEGRVHWVVEPMSDVGHEFQHLYLDGKHVASVIGCWSPMSFEIHVPIYLDYIQDRFIEIYPMPEMKNPNHFN